MSKADTALANVQNLYIMQVKLLDLLQRDLRDPIVRKEVRINVKEFEHLLSQADWRYMGGMDVWETLTKLPEELAEKLKNSKVAVMKTKAKKKSKRK